MPPGGPLIPNELAASPAESALGLGLVLVGLPVYGLWARRRAQDQ